MSETKTKLDILVESEGFETAEEMHEAFITDSVYPAICCNDGCEYTASLEPDQDAGWCDECGTGSMKSGLVLAGLV